MSVSEAAEDDNVLLEQAKRLLSAGQAKEKQGDAAGAVQLFEQVRACGLRIKDAKRAKPVEGVVVGNLGNAYRALGQYEEAVDYYKKALATSREMSNRRGEGIHLGNLGLTYDRMGEYQLAIQHHMQALSINRELGDQRGECHNLGNLGLAYDSLGLCDLAIWHYMQALTISREMRNGRRKVSHLGNLSPEEHQQAIENLAPENSMAADGYRLRAVLEVAEDSVNDLDSVIESLGQHERTVEDHTEAELEADGAAALVKAALESPARFKKKRRRSDKENAASMRAARKLRIRGIESPTAAPYSPE